MKKLLAILALLPALCLGAANDIRVTQTYSNNITLAIVLNQVQGNNWSFCRYIPAGKFVRIRVGSVTGTASATINTNQQEVLH